jgi:hypothetical protein
MKTDPDFHPTAARWLDGQSTGLEQTILQETLTDRSAMKEFAQLCLTESMLQANSTEEKVRRQTLDGLLSGKTVAERQSSRRRFWQGVGAAALFCLSGWIAWPQSARNGAPSSPPVTAAVSPKIQRNVGLGDIPPASAASSTDIPELQRLLQRTWLADFKASGTLTEVVTRLNQEGGVPGAKPIACEATDFGDASVQLNFKIVLPAWTLLKLVALQTGTELECTQDKVIFNKSPRSLSREGSRILHSETMPLRTLFGITEAGMAEKPLTHLSILAAEGLGGNLTVEPSSPTSVKFSGSPRDVGVLDLALDDLMNPLIHVSLTAKWLSIAPDLQPGANQDESGTGVANLSGPGLAGVFTERQFQMMMRELSGKKGVNLFTAPIIRGVPNQEIFVPGFQGFSPAGNQTKAAVFEAKLTDLSCMEFKIRLYPNVAVNNQERQPWEGSIMIWTGQTIAFEGFPLDDGSTVILFVSCHYTDEAGNPFDESKGLPLDPETAGLPLGILSKDRPGFIFSPFAPDQPLINIHLLKSGDRVQCPFTGKNFLIPPEAHWDEGLKDPK